MLFSGTCQPHKAAIGHFVPYLVNNLHAARHVCGASVVVCSSTWPKPHVFHAPPSPPHFTQADCMPSWAQAEAAIGPQSSLLLNALPAQVLCGRALTWRRPGPRLLSRNRGAATPPSHVQQVYSMCAHYSSGGRGYWASRAPCPSEPADCSPLTWPRSSRHLRPSSCETQGCGSVAGSLRAWCRSLSVPGSMVWCESLVAWSRFGCRSLFQSPSRVWCASIANGTSNRSLHAVTDACYSTDSCGSDV